MLNTSIVEITEILDRVAQGTTRPFRCRGIDGNVYIVKSLRSAGLRGLTCEWLGSCLARQFGLPVALFSVVEVPSALASAVPEHLSEIGEGYAFGSKQVDFPVELDWGTRQRVSQLDRVSILAFDWWVKNEDRTLTENGGNPNLLWSVEDRAVTVIDHNLVFDDNFNSNSFISTHVFASDWNDLAGDLFRRKDLQDKMCRAIDYFESFLDQIPDSWIRIDYDSPSILPFGILESDLRRCEKSQFWSVA